MYAAQPRASDAGAHSQQLRGHGQRRDGQYGGEASSGVEQTDTRTIMNNVNVKKRSVRVLRSADGTRLRAEFDFDAAKPCDISLLWLACEDADKACVTESAAAWRGHRPEGLAQRFGAPVGSQPPSSTKEAVGTGASESDALFAPENGGLDLAALARGPRAVEELPPGSFGLIIRLEVREGELGQATDADPAPGAALPAWKQSQMTYVSLALRDEARASGAAGEDEGTGGGERRGEVGSVAKGADAASGDMYSVATSVVRQKIWVDGLQYELQEIYGMESGTAAPDGGSRSSDASAGGAGTSEAHSAESVEGVDLDEGKECVICLSEPRNTTVMPCRHMCLCSDCAGILRYQQGSKCPICRSPVVGLLCIKVEDGVQARGAEAAGSS